MKIFMHDPLHMQVKSVTGFFCKMKNEFKKKEKQKNKKNYWLRKL